MSITKISVPKVLKKSKANTVPILYAFCDTGLSGSILAARINYKKAVKN